MSSITQTSLCAAVIGVLALAASQVSAQVSDQVDERESAPLTPRTELPITLPPPPKIGAKSTCFCKITVWHGLLNQCSSSGYQILMDLTATVGLKFGFRRNAKKFGICSGACSAASNQVNLVTLANLACSLGVPNGSVLKTYAKLGHCGKWGRYKVVDTIGTLTNTPEVTETTCTCPPGWLANTTNVDGGETADGKCKRLAAIPITVTPLPANGTPVGSWGFTWDNGVWAWGTSANGGAASCTTTVVTPAVCEIN